jgi:predicted acetyltransferase
MVDFYIDYYSKRRTSILALYPFRPDFYRKMGWGYGAKVNQYRIKPIDLPAGQLKTHIVYAAKKDLPALNACYHRYTAKTHGMIRRTKTYGGVLFREGNKVVAVKKGNKIEAFMVFSFKTSTDENWLDTQIDIAELIYENREALSELLAFLRSQSDQVNRIQYATHDEFLHFLPHDPRSESGRLIPPVAHETNISGVGIMYRIIDTHGLFRALKNHDFNGQNCRLKITVLDTMYPKHAGSYIVHFVDGKPQVKSGGKFDVEISMDVADYSSMVMGVIPFDKLYEYGLAEISEKVWLTTVTKIFSVDRKPMCITQF